MRLNGRDSSGKVFINKQHGCYAFGQSEKLIMNQNKTCFSEEIYSWHNRQRMLVQTLITVTYIKSREHLTKKMI